MTVVSSLNQSSLCLRDGIPKQHRAKVCSEHPQLKNLISTQYTGEEFNPIYYTNDFFIWKIYPNSEKVFQVGHMLTYQPVCLLGKCGYIASGGLAGQFDYWSPNLKHKHLELGPYYNNGIEIHKRASDHQPEALISTNDRSVKVVDLTSGILTRNLRHSVNMNHASVSNDGRYMVCVGDSPDLFFYEITRSGDYILRHTVQANTKDSSICTSISQNNEMFACASQDSSLSVFDVRYMKLPMLTKTTSRNQPDGSVRSCHFTPPNAGPLDLLLYTEGTRVSHLLDLRTNRDIELVLPEEDNCPFSTSQGICGSCFADDGSSVYVASATHLYEWNIDKKSRKAFPSYAFA
ncbi:WD40/YVTN repeat-like protein [Schizosaccharomyces osmophilus]|uniref:WD40/YVTN repeat-like protein n=1 Tax=Schizosaccharomyces osmophilus TaxID=2545709 RepID=A0AAE9WIY1_9SCHI|nr:WD40/YVTN repeat-like protein [Schizosaccharomyces osmophilus]WBW75351.1 WD40/YVTN repeat-like protein [Schizosaccharomyces osmophilus]